MQDKNKIYKILEEVEKRKRYISYHRDKLRDIYDNLNEIMEPFDRGIDGLENGISEIREGLEAISEVV